MKKVRFLRNGYETVMNDKLAAIYAGKKKVEILDGKPAPIKEKAPLKAKK